MNVSQKWNAGMEKRWEAACTTVTVLVCCVAWRSIRPLGFPATSFPGCTARLEGKGKCQESRTTPGQLNISQTRLISQSGIVLGWNTEGFFFFKSLFDFSPERSNLRVEAAALPNLRRCFRLWFWLGDFVNVRARYWLKKFLSSLSQILALHVCSGTKEEWMAPSHRPYSTQTR